MRKLNKVPLVIWVVALWILSIVAIGGYTVIVDAQRKVPTPTPRVKPAKRTPTARCKDGTYSYSQSRRGTCSHHGGVEEWY